MSIRTVSLYRCEFCGIESESPEKERWFLIDGVKPDVYLCKKCFHNDLKTFKKWLDIFGIKVNGKYDCTQYSDDDELGFVEVESVEITGWNGGLNLNWVRNKETHKDIKKNHES